jgi:hypothetical protein
VDGNVDLKLSGCGVFRPPAKFDAHVASRLGERHATGPAESLGCQPGTIQSGVRIKR